MTGKVVRPLCIFSFLLITMVLISTGSQASGNQSPEMSLGDIPVTKMSLTLTGGSTGRVSVASDGTQSDRNSEFASISEDGRYIAFMSLATNLVDDDSSGGGTQAGSGRNIFVHDWHTGITQRISVSSTGEQANNDSLEPSISGDGNYVAFRSSANNLVPDDTNEAWDIFVKNRITGEIEQVSVASDGTLADGYSYWPSVSFDGRFIAFHSSADNFTEEDTGWDDIFVHDRLTGQTSLISKSSSGEPGNKSSEYPSISSDGRYVAFESTATNFVSNDTINTQDVFVHDRQTGETVLVSVSHDGSLRNGGSYAPSISADGRYITFRSNASNLIDSDGNDADDIFVYDRQSGDTERVSVNSDGIEANSGSVKPSISADGRYVSFVSYATNLVPDDTNDWHDVFIHDRETGRTVLVSKSSDGTQGSYFSTHPDISASGKYVVFESGAPNLVSGDTNDDSDIFIHQFLSSISGRVTFGDGSPADGINISTGSGVSSTTDPSGDFLLDNLPPDEYTITPNKTHYAFSPTSLSFSVPSDVVGADFIAGLSISGTVKHGDGSAASGVVISDGDGHSSTTNSSGEYDLEFLPPGSYTLVATKTGYTFSPPARECTLPPTAENINFIGGLTISGRVTYQDGSPISNVEVTTQDSISAITDNNGEYTIHGLLPGTYTLQASKESHTFSTTSLDVTVPPDATEVDFIGGLTISGRITYSDSSGVNGVTISNGSGYSTTTNMDGDYILKNLAPGLQTITPMKSGYVFTPTSLEFSLPPSQENANFLGGFSITGTVSFPDDSPIQGVTIQYGTQHSTETDHSGDYSLDHLPPGTYSIFPEKPGFLFSPTSLSVTVPPTADGINFTGVSLCEISGKVVDLDGNPLPGVAFEINHDRYVFSDHQGLFAIKDLEPGYYDISIIKSGYSFSPSTLAGTVPPDISDLIIVGTEAYKSTFIPFVTR